MPDSFRYANCIQEARKITGPVIRFLEDRGFSFRHSRYGRKRAIVIPDLNISLEITSHPEADTKPITVKIGGIDETVSNPTAYEDGAKTASKLLVVLQIISKHTTTAR